MTCQSSSHLGTALDSLDPSALRPLIVEAFTMQTTTRSARVSSRACCPVAKTRLRVRAAVTNGSDNGGDGGAFSRISTMHRLIKNAGGTILVPGGASDPSETFTPRIQSGGQHSIACPFALQDAMSNALCVHMVCAGCYDALSAQCMSRSGFKAAFVSGYAVRVPLSAQRAELQPPTCLHRRALSTHQMPDGKTF